MTEPTNAVLEEKIKAIQKDFYEYRKISNRKFEAVNERVTLTKELADEVSFTLVYMKESMDNMNNMMDKFMGMVGKQNEKIDDSVNKQNEQITEFVNSDKVNSSKREFAVSILQVASGILVAVIGFWTYGKL